MPKHTIAALRVLAAIVFVVGSLVSNTRPLKVKAAPLLPNRFVRISNSTVNQTAQYVVGFRINELTTTLGSIEITFCTNSPISGEVCDPIPGFDISAAALGTQTGNTGFIITSSTAGSILLSRVSSMPSNAASTYQFLNVTNPSAYGSHYLRLKTFSSSDGTGTEIEEGGAVFSMNGGVNINTTVPPYLKLCASVTIVNYDCATATSFLIDLGEFSKSTPKAATSELVVATNAGFGYTITMVGTTLVSGNNTITALASGGTSTPGTAQFGINLRSNSNPNIGVDAVGPGNAMVAGGYNSPNNFRFVSPDVIVSGTGSTDNKKFTITYLANIDVNQPPGVYATTLTYIALANF